MITELEIIIEEACGVQLLEISTLQMLEKMPYKKVKTCYFSFHPDYEINDLNYRKAGCN